MAHELLNEEEVWYSQYFQGCHKLERMTELPSLVARLSFQYEGLGGASPSESCFEEHARKLKQLIQRLFNRNSLVSPVFITQVANLPKHLELNDSSWYELHRMHPLKYNPSCFDLKWSVLPSHIGHCLISETERHLLVVTLTGNVMDPIRWSSTQQRNTQHYSELRAYLSTSLSKTLQNMNLLRSALTMDPMRLQMQEQMSALECDVKLTFDLFTLGAELKIRDETAILSTVTTLLGTPEKMDQAFNFRVTEMLTEFAKAASGIPLLPQRPETSAKLNQVELYVPKIPPLKLPRGMPGPKVCYQTGPVLSDLVRERSGPPDLTEKIFWCLRTGTGRISFGYRTIDAVVNIKSKTPIDAADPGGASTYAESYRSSVDMLVRALEELKIRHFVWYLMPVNFKFPSPTWKISFDYLSLTKSFKLKKKILIQGKLKDVLQTLAKTEGLDYTLEVLDTFEKFTRDMCGVPLVMPKCDGEYCFELTSHSGFLVYLNYHPQYEGMKLLPGASAKVAQLCKEVPKMLSEQPFWFGNSFVSCARARDIGSYSLLVRFQLSAENFGPMNVDEQCLVKVREQLTAILNAEPANEKYKTFTLKPIPPLLSSTVDPSWITRHQDTPFLTNPICFKKNEIGVRELRLDIQTAITLTQANATDIASIKTHLDQHISGMGFPTTISPLQTEIGAFEMSGNEFTGHYNIIFEASVLDKQTFDGILAKISQQSTRIQVSLYRGTVFKFEPAVHKIVAWVEKQVPASGAEPTVQRSYSYSDATEFINSVEASVGRLGLEESLLTLRFDECVGDSSFICKGRLIFDLFRLGLSLKTSDHSGTVRVLTELVKSQENLHVADRFTLKGVAHDFSSITSTGQMSFFELRIE
ncbi:hypothetical protein CRM22_005719 [Opisthorchis felineus]|uniref:Uncharacterized protein n=1 Tax=Opisthorchis felineus TaxID=147828 RepID=A0A4S2LPT2_OPIFE|nr:hypothetical protein CRM22_005719 [Opisthorchis felineus]